MSGCTIGDAGLMVDRYGYQTTGSGRWVSMTLRKPRRQKGLPQRKKAMSVPAAIVQAFSDDDTEDGVEDKTRPLVSHLLLESYSSCSSCRLKGFDSI